MSNAIFRELGARTLLDGATVALRDDRRELRYRELIGAIETVADWLRATGCKAVALRAENSVDWVLADLACQMADVVCIPLPDFFTLAQTAHCLRAAGADLLVTDTGLGTSGSVAVPGTASLRALPLAPGATARLPEGTRKITFTSGSTGEPKGVCLDAGLQWRVARALTARIDPSAQRHLALLPLPTLLENVAGIYASLLRGGSVLLPGGATRGLAGSSGLDAPALLRCIEVERPHSAILVPQLLTVLVAACTKGWQPPDSLRFVAVGGARVAAELVIEARRYGLPVFEGYGLSECGSVVALNTSDTERLGSAGHVLPHCAVSVEEGEIVVRGACHLGYVGDPESWHPEHIATGDLGALDAAGFLRVSGRRKNVLISAYGRNVSPEWIESELCARPLLTACVVVGDGRPFPAAVLCAPASVDDAAIQRWISHVNCRLPDYARIGAWLRLDAAAWSGLSTANGRPRRAVIETTLRGPIDRLYASARADGVLH